MKVYVWTLTKDHSSIGRRPDEHKLQLMFGRHGGSIACGPEVTLLLGFSPIYGVFVAYDARFYSAPGKSMGCYARDDLLAEARDTGWGVRQRKKRTPVTVEAVVAFRPGNLGHLAGLVREADATRVADADRTKFFARRAPHGDLGAVRAPIMARLKVLASRWKRSSRFRPSVLAEYSFGCAFCGVQLGLCEAAHIRQVFEPGSTDDPTNGVALCPNHHSAFDAQLVAIEPVSFSVVVSESLVVELEREGWGAGATELRALGGRAVAPPHFWHEPTHRSEMLAHLTARWATFAA